MGKIRKILGFLSFLFVCIYGANSFADGYVCNTSAKTYTSCNANYYMSGGTSAGNSCESCGANSSTSANNTSATCNCATGYSSNGTPSGASTSTSGCSRIAVTVTYNCGTGTGTKPSNGTATYGQSFTPATNTCTKTGYHFTGWKDSSNTDRAAGTAFTSSYTSNQTFTAQWAANTYTVSFNTNNATSGSPNIASVTCTYDQNCPTFATQGTLLRTNYTFGGWNTNNGGTGTTYAAGTTTANNLTTTNGGTVTLYAKWTACSCGSDTNATCAINGVTNNTCYYVHTCTNGYYNTNNGGLTTNNALTCSKCSAGAKCPAGATGETVCGTNEYSDAGETVCHGCTTGYSNSGNSASNHANQGSCSATITLDKNDGSGSTSATKTCYQGSACDFGSASSLSQTGYTFTGGWSTTKGYNKCTSPGTTTSFTNPTGTYYACKTINTYTVTVKAGNGISTVASSGWTGTGTGTMSKTFPYYDTLVLGSTVTPSFKTGYSGVSYTKTSGNGSLNGDTFIVGAGDVTITVNATTLAAPTATISGSETTIYNYTGNATLTGTNATSYDSGVTVTYSFGNSPSTNGTYDNWTTASTTNTLNVARNSYRGTLYYKVKVTATGDGGLTTTTTSASPATLTFENKAITFDANGGTRSGTSPLYVSYNNATLYTTATGSTTGTLPTSSKAASNGKYYVWNGWFTDASAGSQIYNGAGTITSNAISGYTSSSKWVATEQKTLYAHYGECSCTKGTNVDTCTVTGVTNNKCQYSYSCVAGYNNSGSTSGTFEGSVGVASKSSPNCVSKNSYTITVKAGHGFSTVAASGWTNTGTGTMSKTFSYLDTIDLSSVVTPTRKSGYNGTKYTVTTGSGSISGTTFTVGVGNGTITVSATGINAPTATISGGTTLVYNKQTTTLTAGSPGSYDSDITVKYRFGYSATTDGTYDNWSTASTTNTFDIAKNAYRGTRYYKVEVTASDGTLTNAVTTSSGYTAMTLENKQITFNANGGTVATASLYAAYDDATLYTTATGSTTGTVPWGVKSASGSTYYVSTGWYTGASSGSQIYNGANTITSSTVSGYTSGSKWVATEPKTLYARYTTCSCTNGSNINTCTVTGVTDNKCQYSYTCSTGYTNATNGVFEGTPGVGNNTSPNCIKNDVAIITLDSKFYTSSSDGNGTNADTAATPTPLYLWLSNGWYTNNATTTAFTGLTQIPAYSNYVFGGFYTDKTGTGTKIIDSDGSLASGVTNTQFSTSKTLYAKWTQCVCTNGTGATGCTAMVSNNKCNYTWSCNTKYWHATQSASAQGTSFEATCNSCPTNYNEGSDGNRKSRTNCYVTKNAACVQKSCETPTNCDGVTCVASCSCTSGVTYKQYSNAEGTGNGSTSGTTSQECTKGVSSVTASAGYYVSGTSCLKCSDKNANYPYSVGGNTGGWTACYSGNQQRPWTPSQTPCANPDPTGCAGVTCASCSNPSCTYTAYLNAAGTGDGTVKSGCSTNDSACQQGVAELSAKPNFWVSGTTNCPACNVPFTDTGYDNCANEVSNATAATKYFERTCYKQTSSGGNIGSNSCSGTQNCENDKVFGTCYVTACATHYHKNTETNATSCEPNVYTVTLSDTDGTGGMGSIKEVYNTRWTNSVGTTITEFTKPTRTGWNFTGYFDSQTGGSKVIDANGLLPSATAVTSNTTLFAQWSACAPCDPGTGATCSLSVVNNVCTYTTSCKDGYHGLTGSGTKNPSCTANTYTVTYNANGGTGTTASSSHTYDASKNLTANGFTNGTKKFLGWSTSSTATSATYTNSESVKNLTATNNGTVTLYAIWTSCPACAAGDGANCTLSAPLGVCTYATSCKDGYHGLTGSGTKNPSCTANTYTVRYNANATGATGSTANSSHTYGAAKTLTANGFTNGTKKFLGWSTSSTATSATYTNSQSVINLTTTNNDTVDLYAVWENCPACAAGTGANCELSAPSGVCTYTTSCKDGYHGLTGSGTKNPSCTANTYTVTYNANGGTGTTASSSHTYDASKNLTANGFTNGTKKFLGWSTNSTATSATYTNSESVKNLSATNNGTFTLYAVWENCPACAAGTGANCELSAPLGVCTYATSCATGYNTIVNGGKYNPSCTANTYTVTYNANATGATGTTASSSHTYDASKNLTANGFTNGTKKFLGWSTSSTATSATYTNSESVKNLSATNNGTVTLYAIWTSCPACAAGDGANCTLSAPLGVCTYTTSCVTGYGNIQNNGKYNPSCSPNTYTVTLNKNTSNSDTTTVDTVSATYDAVMPLKNTSNANLSIPTNGNNTITGYYDARTNGTKYYNVSGNTITSAKNWDKASATTLYAHWSACDACSAGTGATCSLSVVNNVCTYATSCATGYNTIVNGGKYNPSCTANTYTVTYNANATGATGTTASSSHTYDAAKTLTANGFTNGTKKFLGWSTNSTATSATYTNSQSVINLTTTNNGTVTLYAIWTSCPACAAGTGANCTLSAPLGVCTYTTSCKNGYNTLANGGKYNPSCTANEYLITYTAGQGGSGEDTYQDVTYNATFVTKPDNTFTKEHAVFHGWIQESNKFPEASHQYTYDIVGNTILTADWMCVAGYELIGNACEACQAGYYKTGAGNEECTAASTAWFAPGRGGTQQFACVQGSYTDTTAQASCKACNPGYTNSGNGNSACTTPCPAIENLATWKQPVWAVNNTMAVGTCLVDTCNACVKGTGTATCDVMIINNTCVYNGTCSAGYNTPVVNSKTIVCSPNTYTVQYDCGTGTDGTTPTSGTATYNATFTPAANGGTCLKTGYSFAGWKVSGTADTKNSGFTWTYLEDKTFTAQWTPNVYTITLDDHGNLADSEIVNLAAEPQTLYMKYDTGWFTDANATNQITELTRVPLKNTGYEFSAYTFNGDEIIDVTGTFLSNNFTAENTTIVAVWMHTKTVCGSGQYYTGSGSVCATCLPGKYCDGGSFDTDAGPAGLSNCPDGGTTVAGANSINKCYKTGLNTYVANNGNGTRTCDYNSSTNSYDTQCRDKVITACNPGYYYNENATNSNNPDCVAVGDGYYSPANDMARTACPQTHPHTDANDVPTSRDYCYAECTLAANAQAMNGRNYYNPIHGECSIASCNAHYYLKAGACAECESGYFCDGTAGTEADGRTSCAAATMADNDAFTDWAFSAAGASSVTQCYTNCSERNVNYGKATPDHATEFYPQVCTFTGKSTTGNPCKIADLASGECIEAACGGSFEMKSDGKCHACDRPHASGYAETGNCIVTQCDDGFHPYGDKCISDSFDCTDTIPHATKAAVTWDEAKNTFGVCTLISCDEEAGYHAESNACIPDERACVVDNGVGTQSWNNGWQSCTVTSCNAGFTPDNNDQNCVPCDNLMVGGEVAVSSYARACEIASCMYQGEKYRLDIDNNECKPICTDQDDDTGTRYWDEGSKKCVQHCKDGYLNW